MKKVNVIRTATFLTLCSVLTGCGVLMSGNSESGGAVSNPTTNDANKVSTMNSTTVNSGDSSYVRVNSGMLAINRELIAVLDKEHVLNSVSNSKPSSKTLNNQGQATTSKVSKGIPVVDKVKRKNTSSASAVTVSTGVSSSKKASSSSYQGMTVAEQSKLDARVQA